MPDTRRQAGRIVGASVGTRRNQTPRNSDRIWRGTFDGLELSLGTAPDQDISVAAGICRDSTNAHWMDFSAAVTDKENTNTWAEGSGNGGMDDGISVAADTFYTVHGLLNSVTGSTDAIISAIGDIDGSTARADTAVVTAGYTHSQLLGFAKTDGTSDFLQFTQNGDDILWDASVLNVGETGYADTNLKTHTLASVPTGVNVFAHVSFSVDEASADTFYILGHGDISTLPIPSSSHFDLKLDDTSTKGSVIAHILTDTSQRIKSRSSDASATFKFETKGWRYKRGS